jgi:putative Holliday junction resolvase
MRILALDHGTKRVGVAISDELKMLAHPHGFLPAEPFGEFLAQLKGVLKDREVELILVGMPRNMDGSYGPAAVRVEAFVAALRNAVTIPIQTVDERLTTVQAQRFLTEAGVSARKQKERVDPAAATVILQGHLDALAAR